MNARTAGFALVEFLAVTTYKAGSAGSGRRMKMAFGIRTGIFEPISPLPVVGSGVLY